MLSCTKAIHFPLIIVSAVKEDTELQPLMLSCDVICDVFFLKTNGVHIISSLSEEKTKMGL